MPDHYIIIIKEKKINIHVRTLLDILQITSKNTDSNITKLKLETSLSTVGVAVAAWIPVISLLGKLNIME